ncbi:putative FCH domain, AH/BAR domain superfamily, Mu domain-containing protein [Septoria linicola]|nr:putative FCH domain, AH/BAR domain superfamily, Mu domain-containing protein [Septoria linicola]
MADTADRSDYPGLLTKLQPTQAVDVLTDRVTQIKRLNYTIADWLQERSRLEEQYAAGLRKLARKQIGDEDLGIFTTPWGSLTSSMEALAESHSSLASRIEVDVERPLRDYVTNNRDLQAMPTIQGNLSHIAKEIDKAQKTTDKLSGKGESADATKVANASSDLDNARAQWLSQAPYVFENLQALDEARVNQLRDTLTQFVTLDVDQNEKSRGAAEQALNVLLNVETADEIKTFALKAAARRPSEARPSNRASMFVGSSASGRGGSSGGLQPIQSIPDDAASHTSGSAPEPQKKGAFKGLKRLGTVMSRRGNKQSQQLASTDESPERKPKSSPFGRLGRNKNSYSLEPPQEEAESSERPQSPLRRGSEVLEAPRTQGSTISSSQPPQLGLIPHVNGAGSGPNSASSPSGPTFESILANGGHQSDLADLDPPKPSQPQAYQTYQPAGPAIPTVAEPQRDNDGFSVPPPQLDPISQAQADAGDLGDRQEPQFNVNIRNAPIQEEGGDAALASMATKLAPPPTQRRLGTVRGRRDARNSAIVSTYGAPDGFSSESANASPSFQSQPNEIATPAAPAADPQVIASRAVEPPVVSQAPQPAAAGLVQSPSGAFSPVATGQTAFAPLSPPSEPQSPVQATQPVPLAAQHTGDNHSIRSGRSLQSSASQAHRHPELSGSGLNSSIIETVSARFENGHLTSSSLIGEIALAYNPAELSSTRLGQETIRLENFSQLEKVAPNPAFIGQSLDREGEYSVNLANITRTSVAFKYQVRGDSAQAQTPLLLTPAFKIEQNLAMVIVSYSLHPSFATSGSDSVTLHNVTIALTLEGAKASSCQSKPVGTFSREKNLIFWQLNEITLRPGGEANKLLARFVTDGPATGGHVEGRWEIVGDATSNIGSGLAVSVHGASEADPFADESAAAASAASSWKGVPTQRKLVSGQYVAKS